VARVRRCFCCDGTSPVVRIDVHLEATQIPQPGTPTQLHATSHDGGAIYAHGGRAPMTLPFLHNTTECAAARRSPRPSCGTATLARCVANIARDRRSAAEHGRRRDLVFSMVRGRSCGCSFRRMSPSRHDAGSSSLSLWSAPRRADNVFTANDGGGRCRALFVGGQDTAMACARIPSALDKFPVVWSAIFSSANTNSSKTSARCAPVHHDRAPV